MPSTYTGNLGIELPADGELDGVWGDVVNENMQIVDRATNGSVALTLTGASSTLTTTDGALSDGQYKLLVLAGTPSGTHTITIAPSDAQKIYFVRNTTAQSVVFTQGSGSNVTIATGDSGIIYADGAGAAAAVINITNDFAMGSVKITGGTIDGTAIGGSTPAAISGTTGSFSGNLTVDTNTLFVDAANNRVGIVTSSPATQLEVVGTIRASGSGPRLSILDTGGATDEKEWSLTSADGPLRLFGINEAGGGSGDYIEFTRVGNSVRTIKGARAGGTSYELSNFDRSLMFSGGVSTIGTATAHDLVVDTNNSERMRITSTGNVGIGTTNPTFTLDVNGSIIARTTLTATSDFGLSGAFNYNGASNFYIRSRLNGGTVVIGTETPAGTLYYPISIVGASDYTAFNTSTSEAMRIIANGNVGIGTSTPLAMLDVLSPNNTAETVAVFGNAVIKGLQITTNGNLDWGFNAVNSRNLTFSTNQTEKMRITSAGHVLIGTDSSTTDLAYAPRLKLSGSGPALYLEETDTTQAYSISTLSGSLFVRDATASSVRITITSAGNVGIGTSAPDVGLQYTGDTPKFRIESTNSLDDTSGTEEIGRIEWEGTRSSNRNVSASIRARQAGTWSTVTPWLSPTALEFYTQDNTGVEVTAPRLHIGSTGNVGIGTSSPAALLHLQDDSFFGVRLQRTGGSPSICDIYNSGSVLNLSNDSDGVTVSTGGTPTEKMRITSTGNVGIGESAPDYKLDVNGTFGFTPGASVTPVDNGDVVFELTNNTTLTVKAKGSDGVVRSATLTLA